MQTLEADGWSLTMFINPKGLAREWSWTGKGKNQFRVQEVQSGRPARCQGRQNGQAGGYRVQKQARVKTRRTRKRRIAKAVWEKHAG